MRGIFVMCGMFSGGCHFVISLASMDSAHVFELALCMTIVMKLSEVAVFCQYLMDGSQLTKCPFCTCRYFLMRDWSRRVAPTVDIPI